VHAADDVLALARSTSTTARPRRIIGPIICSGDSARNDVHRD